MKHKNVRSARSAKLCNYEKKGSESKDIRKPESIPVGCVPSTIPPYQGEGKGVVGGGRGRCCP